MRILKITVILAFLISFSAKAQTCDCSADVDTLIGLYENDYSGHDNLSASSAKYKRMVRSLRKEAQNTTDVKACEPLLQSYINYVADGHVYMKQTASNPYFKRTDNADFSRLEPSFSVISDSTLYIRIPSADLRFRSRVDSLVRSNAGLFNTKPNLIIDVRGNRGGGDGVFAVLKPYLYTGPVVRHLPEFWTSPGNIGMYRELSDNSLVDTSTRSFLKRLIAKMERSPLSFVPMFDHATDTVRYDAVLMTPRKVGIMIDRKCGSATEEFLLFARQSSKVKIFGKENSSGTLDYSNLRDVVLPSGMWVVTVPTSRSSRLPETPFDKIGVAPDIMIRDADNAVQEVMRHLEGRR